MNWGVDLEDEWWEENNGIIREYNAIEITLYPNHIEK